jgi:hypothetical protein
MSGTMATKHPHRPRDVDDFMATLDHPLKAEVQRLRGLIKGVDPDITEQVKWKAPSFSCAGEYLVTFNLRATRHVHLVFHNPRIAEVDSDLLEGDYPDRRMAYFTSAQDVRANEAALVGVIGELVRLNRQNT